MKSKVPEYELSVIGSEVFNLAIENALDGDRLKREAEAAAKGAEEARELEQKLQTDLL
jgi:hypothetical protein